MCFSGFHKGLLIYSEAHGLPLLPLLYISQKKVDERLNKRGPLIPDLEFVKRYADKLKEVNGGKKGRPFEITYSYVIFPAVLRYVLVRFR